MHYCSTVNEFSIFEEPDLMMVLWQGRFLKRKIAKNDYSFIVVNQNSIFIFSLLFNVKSGLILIQKLVSIHNPEDNSGQVKMFCCKIETFFYYLRFD